MYMAPGTEGGLNHFSAFKTSASPPVYRLLPPAAENSSIPGNPRKGAWRDSAGQKYTIKSLCHKRVEKKQYWNDNKK
jgi:hypothetical protein